MAKKSAIERDLKRRRMIARDKDKRGALKAIIRNRKKPIEERMQAQIKLASLPRNGCTVRARNRCQVSGRSRAVYRKFGVSRIAVRDLGGTGMIPGLVKSSW